MLKLLTKFEAFNHIRWRALVASAMIFFAAATAMAQARRAEHKGPRGIAVIEFAHAPAAGQPPSGTAKLLPVTIFYNGAYHDASLYEATPEPMAVQTGTVYEVQRDGEALGLFTTTMPRQDADWWYALGNWQPNLPESAASKEPAKKPAFVNPASNDERPILKRGSSSQQPPQSSSPPAASSPTGGNSAPAASPSSSGSSSSGDEDRPVLKRPASSSEAQPSSPSASQPEEPGTASPSYGAEEQDPNRPVLRRGKPAAETAKAAPAAMAKTKVSATSSSAPASNSRPSNSADASPAAQPQNAAAAFVGVSDTETSDERPYKYSWTKEQQTRLTAKISKLALEEARKYEQQRNLPAGASWEQMSLRAYDLFTNNDGELIFSGTQSVAAPRARKVYVTFAALYDAAGELEPLFTDVTDTEQLDVKGRLELIDAVDSTGDGRGDLLFRRVGISSQKFELYRVVSAGFYKLFEGAVAPI